MSVDKSASSVARAWDGTETRARAFVRGLGVMFTTPGAVLFLTALGFGTLVRDARLDIGHALFLSMAMYALPAQVMVVDQLQRGATLLAVAFAVTLTAVRLLPMTVSLLPWLGRQTSSRVLQFVSVHFIAITAWIEGSRRLPPAPEPLRLAHFYGIGMGMMAATCAGSAVGFVAAARLPLPIQAALLFMTPIYFLLSSVIAATSLRDWLAIGFGALLTPLVTLVFPEADLLIGGVVGGTLAFAASRSAR